MNIDRRKEHEEWLIEYAEKVKRLGIISPILNKSFDELVKESKEVEEKFLKDIAPTLLKENNDK